MSQTRENDQKPNFCTIDPNLNPQFFLWILAQLVARHCSKLSSYVIQRKTNEPNLTK